MQRKKLCPVHPGEILLLEFLRPLAISQYRLAKDMSVPPRRINEIVQGARRHGRHRVATGAVLRYLRAVLAQPAGAL